MNTVSRRVKSFLAEMIRHPLPSNGPFPRRLWTGSPERPAWKAHALRAGNRRKRWNFGHHTRADRLRASFLRMAGSSEGTDVTATEKRDARGCGPQIRPATGATTGGIHSSCPSFGVPPYDAIRSSGSGHHDRPGGKAICTCGRGARGTTSGSAAEGSNAWKPAADHDPGRRGSDRNRRGLAFGLWRMDVPKEGRNIREMCLDPYRTAPAEIGIADEENPEGGVAGFGIHRAHGARGSGLAEAEHPWPEKHRQQARQAVIRGEPVEIRMSHTRPSQPALRLATKAAFFFSPCFSRIGRRAVKKPGNR